MRPKLWSGDVVLVIEDDPELRAVLAQTLEAYGYRTIEAGNGAEGLACMRRQRVDLVLLDLMMPVMDGRQFRAQQLADRELCDVPVVVLSAGTGEATLGIEAEAYLEKPIDARFLVANVQRAIRSGAALRLANAERRAAVGTMAAGMAHEINNPLSYVVANLQELVERMPELDSLERATDLVQRAREALDGALRIRDVVGEIRTLSGAGQEEPEVVDATAAVDRAMDLARDRLAHVGRVSCEHPRTLPRVWATARGLEQVLENLLTNAVEALPEPKRGTIRVSAEQIGDGHVQIVVEDDGAGVADEIRERVFEPFFTTRPPGSSSGLGLSVSQALVRSWGGELVLESRAGSSVDSGTRVMVRLAVAQRGAARPGRADKATNAPPSTRRGRILVVDDEPAVARAIGRVLSADHDVSICFGAREALAILEQDGAFDVVVSDVIMPELGGADLYAEIASRCPGLQRRIVFVTGAAFTESSREFLASVDNVCLSKPIDRGALLAAVRREIEEARA